MNPTLAAVIVAVVLGLGVFPWNATLKKISSPEYLVLEGILFLIGGVIWRLASGPLAMPPVKGIFLGVGTAVVYFAAMAACNYVYANTNGLQMAVATAITAAYPLVTALVAAIIARKMFTPPQTVFFLMAIGGIIGLSFSNAPK